MSEREQKAVSQIVRKMLLTGNQPGMVRQWIDAALKWADENPGAQASAIRDWTAYVHVRPFYTALELTPLIPALGVGFAVTETPMAQMSAKRLANLLDFYRLPKLVNSESDTSFFRHPYRRELEEFYIVEQLHIWKNRRLTQEEFENVAFRR